MLQDSEGFASFSVDDIEQARGFYGTTLGLTVTDDPMGVLLVDLAGRRAVIYPKPDHQPATFTVLNFPVNDIEAAVKDLTGRGVRFESYDSEYMKTDEHGIARDPESGNAIAWFTDPAGNIHSVVQEV